MANKQFFHPKNLAIFSALFIIGIVSVVQAKFKYIDSSEISQWGVSAIDKIRDKEIMTGFADGSFRPKENINRAQAVVLLQRIKKINSAETTGKNIFPDVPSNSWYTKAVIKATQEGWIKGYPDGNFYPDKPVNRAEFATLISRAFDLPSSDLSNLKFKDVSADKWYAQSISIMLKNGFIRNNKAPEYFPRKNITRQDAAWILAKILEKPSLVSKEINYANRKTIRKVAIKPRNFNANKQGVDIKKDAMLISTFKNSEILSLNLSSKDWISIGRLEVSNNLKQKANLDTLNFRLRFEKKGVGPADNFEVQIKSANFQKVARISKKGGVIFPGLSQEITEEKKYNIEVFLRPIQKVSFYAKTGIGHLAINKIEATMFGDLKSNNAIENSRSAPIEYEDRRLTDFNFYPVY